MKGVAITRVPRVEGYKVLGTQLTFHNRCDAELKRREKAAWGAFYKNAEVLCCKAVPLVKRFRFLSRTVEPALFWCAGSWNLTSQQYVHLRGVQRSMVRKMCRYVKNDGETIDEYMRRTEAAISGLMVRHRVKPWDTVARQAVFKWAGWVARLGQLDNKRLTYAVLQHKNLKWVYQIAAQNAGRQMHGRYIRTWRWESILQRHFDVSQNGTYWQDSARDYEVWQGIVSNIL